MDQLPHSKQHEHSLISIMFQDPLVYGKAVIDEFEDGEPFFTPECKLIWEAFKRIDLCNINKYTVSDYLVDRLNSATISEIYMSEPSTAQFELHKQWVNKLFVQRELLEVNDSLRRELLDKACKVDEVLPEAQKSYSGKMLHTGKSSMMTMDKMIDGAIENYQSDHCGFITGHHRLDSCIAPVPEGSLVAIAARPGMGKTTLYNNIQMYLGLDNIASSMFSLEMSCNQLVGRMAASVCRLDSRLESLRKNWNTKEFQAAFYGLRQMPIYAKDTPAISIKELRREILAMNAGEGVKVHGADHLGLIKCSIRKSASRQEEVAYIADTLKETSMEIKGIIYVMVQLNREAEGRIPKLSNCKESGRIEESSDVVVMLHGNRNNDEETVMVRNGQPINMNLIIEKNRHGGTGTLVVPFMKHCSLFPNDRTDNNGEAL